MLNPYAGPCPTGFTEHTLFAGEEPVRICMLHGRWLQELGAHFDLVWASGWTELDRVRLADLLPLPPFVGAIAAPPPPFDPALKVPAVARVAGDRPLAWLDDEFARPAWEWARDRVTPTLLVNVSPEAGLTRAHVEQLLAWAPTA